MSNFNKSIRPVASFTFQTTTAARLCLFPGHYNTEEVVIKDSKAYVSFADPAAIKNAGHSCDQVADDYNATLANLRGNGGTYPVQINPKTPATRYRDFLNYVKYSGLKVVKMRITDLTNTQNPSREIFQQNIEVTQSSIGSKSGSDYVQLSAYINPANFLQNFIDIDLEKDERNLSLDETTLVFLDVPANSNFQIDFTMAK